VIAAQSAAIAQTGAHVAPEKATSTKFAGGKKFAPTGKKGVKKGQVNLLTKAQGKKAKPAGKAATEAGAPHEFSKKAIVLDLLRRKDGATMAEIAKAMDWQNYYADVRIMPTCVGNPACGAGIAAMKSA
jgi:hypothetical protein